jgi:hypothetical protein
MPEFMNASQAKAHCQEDSPKELRGKLCVQAEYSEDYENEVNRCRLLDTTSNIFSTSAGKSRQRDHVHLGAPSGAILGDYK